jgi:Polyphosphate kinase 2 (PPK2)
MSDLDVSPSLLRDLLDELPAAAQCVAPAVRCGDEYGREEIGREVRAKDSQKGLPSRTFPPSNGIREAPGMGPGDRARIVIVFDGRDAAGKGGTIKRITTHRAGARAVVLPALYRAPAGAG